MELDDNEKVSAIPGAENKGEIAYNQAITKLSNLKQETLKEDISVQELQKIKEEILQVIQEAKDANAQQQSANNIVFAGLTFEELPQNVKDFYESKGITATTTKIKDRAFLGIDNFPDGFTIPNSITSIGYVAFSLSTLPDGFIIPSSVTSIDINAFNSAKFSGGFSLPNSITSIGENAFNNAKNLQVGFTIPNSITRIENDVFQGVNLPDGFTIPSSVTSIGEHAFDSTTLPDGFIIPSSVTSIGKDAFKFSYLTNGTPIHEPPQPNGKDLILNSDGTWS